MKDPNLTAPDLVESDFSAAGLQYAKNDKGQMLSLPWSVDYFILYYNKELFQKKGVAVPKTFDEMVAAAEKLTDAKEGTFGFVGRGLRNANMTLWTNFFLNCGGEFLDGKGGILTDGPEAIEATKLYQTLLTKVAPPGVAGFNWMESMASFTQGRSAMWIDGVGWAPPLEDPAASRIVGKVGYTVVPAGPKGQYSATYGDGLGIAAASKNKEAAYLLCQWAVSKTQGARLLQAGGGVPFRNSILNDPEIQKGVKMPKEWLQSVIDSAKISKLGLPVIIPVAEFRDLVGAAITSTLAGADPADRIEEGPRAVPADPGAQRKSVKAITQVNSGRGGHGNRAGARMAAAVLLAIRGAGAGRRAGRHRVSMAVHDLDEPERVEGRLADHLCRARQLSAAAERSPLRRGGGAHDPLHRACRCCCR